MNSSLSLEAFAEITARIDAGQPKDQVLSASGVSGELFDAEQRYWLFEMNRQLARQRYDLEREYSALYVAYRLRFQGRSLPARETPVPAPLLETSVPANSRETPVPAPVRETSVPAPARETSVPAPVRETSSQADMFFARPREPQAPTFGTRHPGDRPRSGPAVPAALGSSTAPGGAARDLRRGSPRAAAPRRELPRRGQPTPRVAVPAVERHPELLRTLPVPAQDLAAASRAAFKPEPRAQTPSGVGDLPARSEQARLEQPPAVSLLGPAAAPALEAAPAGTLSVDQHAYLQAKLQLHPGRAHEICQEFGLDLAGQRTAFQELGRRMGVEPELRERFLQLYEQHRAKFVAPS